MARPKSLISTVKQTVYIPKEYLEKLKAMESDKAISGVSEGVCQALECYFEHIRQQAYEEEIKRVAQDQEFIARTASSFNQLDI